MYHKRPGPKPFGVASTYEAQQGTPFRTGLDRLQNRKHDGRRCPSLLPAMDLRIGLGATLPASLNGSFSLQAIVATLRGVAPKR